MGETKEAHGTLTDEKQIGSSSVITISSSAVVSDVSSKSPSGTLRLEKKEQLIGVKNMASSDASRLSDAKHTVVAKKGAQKTGSISDATLPSMFLTKYLDFSAASKTVNYFSRNLFTSSFHYNTNILYKSWTTCSSVDSSLFLRYNLHSYLEFSTDSEVGLAVKIHQNKG